MVLWHLGQAQSRRRALRPGGRRGVGTAGPKAWPDPRPTSLSREKKSGRVPGVDTIHLCQSKPIRVDEGDSKGQFQPETAAAACVFPYMVLGQPF